MFRSRIIYFLLVGFSTSCLLHADFSPTFSVPVGRSAFAFALSEDETQAVVVNLFSHRADDGVEGANVNFVNLDSGQITRQIQVGTRITSVAIAGQTVVLVNQDEDAVRLVDLDSKQEIARVYSGSRPATALRLDRRTVAIANGTSGDITFLDTERRQMTSSVVVGDDPRMLALHADGRYLYAVLGATGALATIDLANGNSAPQLVDVQSGLISNPVAVSASPNGNRLVIASPTSNSISLLDTSDPARPRLLYNLAAGDQPTFIAFHPKYPELAYLANQWGQYLSVIDTNTPATDRSDALIGVVPVSDAGAAVAFDKAGNALFFLSYSAESALYGFDALALADRSLLQPPPEIGIPGEPNVKLRLNAEGSCEQDFHIARVELGGTTEEGFWGMEVKLSENPRELTGGFNLGGVLKGDGGLPSFGAFSLSRSQQVKVWVAAQGFKGAQALARVELRSDGQVIEAAEGALGGETRLNIERELPPGFYVVRLRSLPGAPRANFQMALEAPGGSFNGGVVVGGFLDRREDGTSRNGFGAFCLPSSQNVGVRVLGLSEYPGVGAEALTLSVLDNDRELLQSYDTALISAVDIKIPEPPARPSRINWYVDDDARVNGNGSASAPFRSITKAINQASPGQTIFVLPGTYGPSSTGETLPIGTRGPGLTGFDENVQLIGSGAEQTIIDAELRPGIGVVLNADGVRMSGFTVKRAGSIGAYVFRADRVTIENNHFTGNLRFGAGGELASGLLVRNNNAIANMESGFAFSGSVPGAPRGVGTGDCPPSPTGDEYGAWIVNNNSSNNRAVGILLTQGGNYCVSGNVTVNNGSSGVELNNRDQEGVGRPPLHGVVINNMIETNGGQQFAHAGTGILSTENNATIDLIEGNRLIRNRPYGIGVFLDGHVGTIRNNQIQSTVSNSILVRVDSTVDQIVDNVITGSGDSGILIANDAEVGYTAGNLIARNDKGLSVLSNSRLLLSESDLIKDNERIGLEVVDAILDELSGGEIHRNGAGSEESGTGIQIRGESVVWIRNTTINDNFGQGGAYIAEGASLTLDEVEIAGNERRGVLAADQGTLVELRDSRISGTLQRENDNGFGITARQQGSVKCSNTILENNEGGNVNAETGNTDGC